MTETAAPGSATTPSTPPTPAAPSARPTRRGRLLRRVFLGVLALVVILLVGGYQYAKPLLLTGTGYAAHNACAVTHLAGRSNPSTDLPPNPLVPFLRESGAAEKSTTVGSSVLGVLAAQEARHTPGFGCTLGGTAPALGTPTTVTASANPYAAVIDPAEATATIAPNSARVAATPAIKAALDAAFDDERASTSGGASATTQPKLGTRAVVAIKDGQVVAERYAPGFSPTTPQLGWSMAKSVTNLLVGRLVQQGKLAVTDAKLRPEWTDERATITVDQLMRMTSGLAWDETYDLGTPITAMLYLEPDMGTFVAKQPLAHPVGTYQQYSSGSTNVLCSVATARAGVTADLPRQQLFAPLGLSSAVWEPDGVGTPVCSSYLWATPRDWAAIGQFALQDGQWGGQQLLPAGWMATSTTAQKVPTTEDPGYAAGWWANRLPDGSLVEPLLPADTYWASGHDGQRLYVVPSEKLVVVRLGFSPKVSAKDLKTTDLVAALITATR